MCLHAFIYIIAFLVENRALLDVMCQRGKKGRQKEASKINIDTPGKESQ